MRHRITHTALEYLAAIFSPWVMLGISLLILWLLSRMALLSWADLSYVLPVTSLGYVATALIGRFFLNEQITPIALGRHAADRGRNGAGGPRQPARERRIVTAGVL